MNEEHFILPLAPPSYATVDVVQEFVNRFEKRKDTIRHSFEKRRAAHEKKHQTMLENLRNEEVEALAALHVSYVQWVATEPPEIETSSNSTSSSTNQPYSFLGLFRRS